MSSFQYRFIFTLVVLSLFLKVYSSEFITADNENFHYSGRIDYSDPAKPWFAYSGVRIRTNFEGTSVSAVFETSKTEVHFYYIIDNNEPVKFKLNSTVSNKLLATGLSDTWHTLELIRLTEGHTGRTEFHGLFLDDGKGIAAPVIDEPRKIEFIGNSITCGYGIEATSAYDPFLASTENFTLSYAGLTAKSFNAEYHATCRSGIGMFRDYGGPDTGSPTSMYNIYRGVWSEDPSMSYWDFTQFQPQVVAINLGTNDYSQGWVDTEDDFKWQYHRFLDTLRTKYSAETHIIVLAGPMNNSGVLINDLNAIVTAHKDKGYTNTYFFEMSAQGELGYGANWHPSIHQAQKNASELISFIEGLTGWESAPVISPEPPTDLSTVLLTTTSVGLSWSDNSDIEDGYILELKTGGDDFIVIDSTGADVNAYTVSGLSLATVYTFRVRAFNANGPSMYSNLSVTYTDGSDELAFVQDPGSQGIISIEAEHFTGIQFVGGHAWDFSTAYTGYSGTAAMIATPDDGTVIDTDYETLSPRLDYKISFTKTGKHYIWIRSNHTNTSNDAFHAGIDGTAPESSKNMYCWDGTNAWVWSKTGTSTGVATIDIESTGIHTIHIWMCDDGAKLDKIVLTTDNTYNPTNDGAEGPPESQRENRPPTANAGGDQTLTDTDENGWEPVTLDGSGSIDSNGTIVNYLWTLEGTELASEVIADIDLEVGEHLIILTVTDDEGASDTDTTSIVVNPYVNEPPIAHAGEDQLVTEGESVVLDGSASADADGTIVSYIWTLEGSELATGITAGIDLVVGEHNIILTVTDDDGASDTARVTILVIPPFNEAPYALAGEDQIITDSDEDGWESVTLDGSASYDNDGTIVSYQWDTNNTVLGSTDIITVNLPVGENIINLTVTDNEGAIDTNQVIIHIIAPPNEPPHAVAGKDQAIAEGESVILNGSASYDTDGTITSYLWTEEGLLLSDVVNPTFILALGTHTIKLTVTDNDGASDTDSLTIVVDEFNPPIAPSGLQVYMVSESQINLSWIDNSGNEEGFEINRKTLTSTYVLIDDLTENSTTHSDIGLEPGTTYIYRLRAFNSLGYSDYCIEDTATTGNMTGIESNNESAYAIYPNPSKGHVNIIAPENTLIEVYSSVGQLMTSINSTFELTEIDLHDYRKGIYFVQFTSGSGVKTLILHMD